MDASTELSPTPAEEEWGYVTAGGKTITAAQFDNVSRSTMELDLSLSADIGYPEAAEMNMA